MSRWGVVWVGAVLVDSLQIPQGAGQGTVGAGSSGKEARASLVGYSPWDSKESDTTE